MIRTDPEMQDEFCYLNRKSHAYDFKIVEFNERNPLEFPFLFIFNVRYMTISTRGITHYIAGIGEFI